MLKLLLLSVLTLPGVWCQHADHTDSLNQLIGSCLSDEACARHLSGAVSNSTNGTNGTTPQGFQINLAGQTDMPMGSLISALAKELGIEPASIRRTGKSSSPCLKCRRLWTSSFTLVILVPDDKTPEALVKVIQQSDLLEVVTVNIAAGTSTASATASYVALPNPAASVTELTDLKTMVNVTEDFVISAFVGIRALLGFDPVNTPDAFGQWSMPILAKVAMIAWANELVWTPPPVKANFSLRVMVVDQCADPVLKFAGKTCKMPYNIDMVSSLYLGKPELGLPRSRAVIGGSLFTEKLVYFAGLHETPTVGFVAQAAELSDKTEYPSFVRTNSPEVGFFKITGLVLNKFGYKTFDGWFCNTNGVQTLIATVTDMYNVDGFRTISFIINPFQYTGCPPGSECDIQFLTRRGQNPNEAKIKKDNYDREIARSLEFNAHAHVSFIGGDCAKWDAFNYFAMKGLVGAGHLWTGLTPIEMLYESSYLIAVVNVVPIITGLTSDFVYQKPFDGSVFLDSNAVLDNRQPYKDFKKLLKYIGVYPEDFLEPWMANKYHVEAYQNFENGLWRPVVNVAYLDAFATVLFAMNAAVIKYGVNFTDAQLLGEVKTVDFEGCGRRIRFDANGDALYRVRVTNYRYAPGFKKHIAAAMGTLFDIGYYEGTMTWLSEPVFYDGATEVPPDQDKSCPPGTRYLRVSAKCEICPVGTFTSRAGQAFCDPCFPGTYSDGNGSKVCKPCGVGTFAMVTGSTGCSTCKAGMYADSVQMSECKDCLVGSDSLPGATLCSLCKRGTYAIARGTPTCTQCAGNKTTFDVGGGSPDLCVCPSGTYRDLKVADSAKNYVACPAGMVFKGEELTEATFLESCKCPTGTYRDQVIRDLCHPCPSGMVFKGNEDGTEADSVETCVCDAGTYRDSGLRALCHPCPTGMFCEEGSDEQNLGFWTEGRRLRQACASEDTCMVPVAVKGFMTRKGEPLRPFKCMNEEVCPGGPPGKCGDFADGGSVACGSCVEGARKDGIGCKECKGKTDKLPVVFAPIVLVLGLAIFIWSVNRDKMMQSTVALSFGLILTIATSTLQTMSMFSSLNVNWFEPLKSTLQSLDFLQFNPEFLKPTCAVAVGASLKFLGRQLIPLVVCMLDFVIVMVYRFCLRMKIDPLVDFTNSIGTIFYGLFISMISNSFTPFVCYPHPDSSWSMLGDASVLCWTTQEHKMMAGVAVALFLIVPAPFLTVVLWATWNHSWFCLEGARGNNRWLLSFSFLFHRFNPYAYYYTLVTMVRGLLICLTPVVIAKDPVLQLCVLGLIIATVGLVSSSIRPWKARSASSSEAVLNMCLLLLIICGASNEDFTPYPKSISGFATFILSAGSTTVFLSLVIALVTFFKPLTRYDVSICCNTKESGGQSRLLKLFLMKHGMTVCLPDMSVVDEVFDVMKHCVKNVVVFLTRSCLTQPVCAGQIAIAHRKKGIKIVGLKLKGFVAPVKEDLDYLPGYLDVTGISLGQMSIDWEMVKQALKFLVDEATLLDLTLMSTDVKERCSAVLAAVLGKEPVKVEPKKPQQNMVLITSDASDEDATAAAGIVALTLNSLGGRAKVAEEETYMLEDWRSQEDALQLVNRSRAVIMVLSRGSLQNRLQLYLIQIGVARMLKNGNTLDSSRLTAFKESRKSTNSKSMLSRRTLQTTSRSGVRFEIIPVVVDGFVYPTATTYINFFQGVSDSQLDGIKAFFERMTFPLVIAASDQIVQMQIEMLARVIPSTDDTQTGSFAQLVTDDVTADQPTEGPLYQKNYKEIEAKFRMIVI